MTAAFPVVREGRPPQTMRFSEFYTRPGCTPVNASPERSPVQTHHSGPKLMANLYFVRLFHSLLSNDFADAPYSYSASPQFKQPSSTSTASLSTVRRGGLSTSTTKSEARHERMLCSCKLRLRRDEPDGRLTQRPSSSSWPPSASCRRGIFLASVGFMPSGHLLGLRRLHAGGASSWPPSASCRRGQGLQLQRPCCGSVFFRRKAAEENNGLGQIARTFRIDRVR